MQKSNSFFSIFHKMEMSSSYENRGLRSNIENMTSLHLHSKSYSIPGPLTTLEHKARNCFWEELGGPITQKKVKI